MCVSGALGTLFVLWEEGCIGLFCKVEVSSI